MPPPLPRHFSPSDKDKKHRPFAPSPFPRRRVSLPVAVSLLCSLVAVTAVAFATSVLLRPPRVVSVFRCGLAVDKFRTFQSRAAALGGGEEREIALRPKLLGVVGVQTRFESADRREALRSTWFPPDPDALVNLDHATGLAFRFVIGRTKNKTKMAELHEEEEKYHDFIFIDIDEEHAKLPYKTLEFFKAAYSLFEADFYVKADDNIYLRPDRLATLLAKERTHSLTYIGCMKKGPVITDPNLKWYESQGHLIGNEYFQHAYGPIYALSAEVVSALASAKNDSLRMFSNEDITIGSWMLAMNVHHEDNKAICEPQCSPRSIAVWDVPKCSGLCDPIKRLRALHNNTMCTKSPTVPLEDED